MIRTALALLLLLPLGGRAMADAEGAARPRLRELVTVTSELVRIGDLVDNAGPAADIPVFRAPDLGQTGTVPVTRVAAALGAHNVTGVDAQGLSEVVVTRLSRAITPKDITDRIARAVARQLGHADPQNLGVVLDRDIRTLHVEASSTADLAVAALRVEPRSGRFDIALELPGSAAARRLPLRFTGTVTETVEAATLTHAMRAGEVIKAADLALERRPKAELANDAVTPEQAVGFAVKAPMRAGVALRGSDLTRPQVVQRNEAVTLLYEVPGITLTVRGKALEGGALGDTIGVLNTQSNRTIQATVTGPARVTVGAAAPVVASAAPPTASESPRTQ